MRLAQKGEKEAYRELLEKVQMLLQSYIKNSMMKMSGQQIDSVDDIVQDTLLGIHLKRSTYDSEQFFLPWMYAIARYKVIDYVRSRKKDAMSTSFEDLENFSSVEHDPTFKNDLKTMLSSLSPKQRLILKLVKLEGLSIQEAAVQTGFSVSDIKVTIHRGMNELQKIVNKEKENQHEKNR